MKTFEGLLLWVLFILLYWTPTIIALLRKIHGFGQVVVVNLFLGWTAIGWIIALVMAFRHVPRVAPLTSMTSKDGGSPG